MNEHSDALATAALASFHPAVRSWFTTRFANPTPCQAQTWPELKSGHNVLLAAPTGSGKTLAAFLAAIDDLIRVHLAGGLPDETRVVYVSPLKALSSDIQINLQVPIQGISARLGEEGTAPGIRAAVRTGDTPASERARMRRQAPHILVTTPESLYIVLTSTSGRRMLASTRTVIVDEIHAVAGSKRGAHLALTLERLSALTGDRLQRIGLSATQKPIDEVARFLTGHGSSDCTIIDAGHGRERDLALELPRSPLQAVMANEVWEEVYDRLAALIETHRTTLIFVNTRRLAERVTRHLSERLGPEQVAAHHGSLARDQRLRAEQRLKAGELSALVATASLELGIDIGEVDLVCQLSSPRSIAAFLQRVGRSGHAVDRTVKGRLFPLTRDDLVECSALVDAVRRGELDTVRFVDQPLDVLAQQLVAMVANEEWSETGLYERVRRAYPYRRLARSVFQAVVTSLAEGYALRRGRRGAYLHRDAVHGILRGRRGALLTAVTCGGAIPDTADYEVREEPSGAFVGTVNEDFAVESLAGDVFQLGNTSWRILRIESGTVRVEDACGLPPNIPFWFGEAPARSDELSHAVARMREELAVHFAVGNSSAAQTWLTETVGIADAAACQLTQYLASGYAALNCLPTLRTLVIERFFDESGGMQLVLHSPYGSRINRAWGLALRKRFCRKFNFELQAAATEDAVVLSLGETHSFVLQEVWDYLHPETVKEVLIQALLDAPMFTTHWRWNATVALAIPRFQGGRKVPPQLQRMQAEDLVAVVFPDQLACLENVAGQRDIPEHPLVQQTMQDCLFGAMDIVGLERILAGIAAGGITTIVRELTEPSPLALEILNARPYAFLDDAPLEERRTQAVASRRWLDPSAAADLGRLDPNAIHNVCEEAWPEADTSDELHDALLSVLVLAPHGKRREGHEEIARSWPGLLSSLAAAGRATVLTTAARQFWVATERLPILLALFPQSIASPSVQVPVEYQQPWERSAAMIELCRARLGVLGPVSLAELNAPFDLPEAELASALAQLEQEGYALRGRFRADSNGLEWCERRLLARMHRYTLQRLRREIEPLSGIDFQRFLFRWHGLDTTEHPTGPEGLAGVIERLAGFEAAATAWEQELLPARVAGYESSWLDMLCLSGRVAWRRFPEPRSEETSYALMRSTPIALIPRAQAGLWHSLQPAADGAAGLSSDAALVHACLQQSGASFFDDLLRTTGLLRTLLENALVELVARGLAHADSFAGIRALLERNARGRSRRNRSLAGSMEAAGRWSLSGKEPTLAELNTDAAEAKLETIARTLLRRYGVVNRLLLVREKALPPWRDLLVVLRRMEARGELRGGRFLSSANGEQFALPEAVGLMRSLRKEQASQRLVAISASDPLNLVGILTPGQKIPVVPTNRLLFMDGVFIAALCGKSVSFFSDSGMERRWEYKKLLERLPGSAGLQS